MPKTSVKQNLLNCLISNALNDLLEISDNDSDSSEKADEIMDEVVDNILMLESQRRAVSYYIPKSVDWRVNVLNYLDKDRYKQIVRVAPNDFYHILSLIENDPLFLVKQQMPVSLQLQIALYRLGSYGEGASIRKTATFFGIGDGGTLQKITKRVFSALMKLKRKYIYWPDESEREGIVQATWHELPGCIGYLDGTEIKFSETPSADSVPYFSRKKQYSFKAQIICDHQLQIRQLRVGYMGSVHDAKIFSQCEIFKNPQQFFSDYQWIAADSAYTLTKTVLTPFRKNSSALNLENRNNFNTRFSSYRVKVEHCIGLLKEKFPSLKELNLRINNKHSLKQCCDWFIICCILHNIIRRQRNAENIYSNQLNEGTAEVKEILRTSTTGGNKRNNLCVILNNK